MPFSGRSECFGWSKSLLTQFFDVSPTTSSGLRPIHPRVARNCLHIPGSSSYRIERMDTTRHSASLPPLSLSPALSPAQVHEMVLALMQTCAAMRSARMHTHPCPCPEMTVTRRKGLIPIWRDSKRFHHLPRTPYGCRNGIDVEVP